LEENVKIAINNFIVGLKTDGIWEPIKASVIMAGARTLNGALVPLKGTAPTNFNFVSGDYNRKTGLVGNGSTKYLDSNRKNDSDPRNNVHKAVYISSASHAAGTIYSTSTGDPGYENFEYFSGSYRFLSRSTTPQQLRISATAAGFYGHSRSSSTAFTTRAFLTNQNSISTSGAPNSSAITLYARFTPALNFLSNARLSFYSLGESLDLALLDARVTQLMTDLGNVIP
jgi:hypothetical protein